MKAVLFSACLLLSTAAFAATAVPFVSLPLVPATHSPGGSGFTLTVHGTGFVSGSTVNWNGSPRGTVFISSRTLRAAITAADIATQSTATVTISSPGGSVSDPVYFSIRTPSPLTLVRQDHTLSGTVNYGGDLAIGDFNSDGQVDVAVTNTDSSSSTLQVFLGNGDGSFQPPFILALPYALDLLKTGDFNGDGKLDLAGASSDIGGQVLLGNGDGTFVVGPFFGLNFGMGIVQIATADFDADGQRDMAITWSDGVRNDADIELGNGDGSFNDLATFLNMNGEAGGPTIGDFNADGKLDIAVPDNYVGAVERAVDIFLGNGNGTFQLRKPFVTTYANGTAATADINGDGLLDLVTDGISVLLNGGTAGFMNAGGVRNHPGPRSMQLADMNGDGYLDAVVNTKDSLNRAAISVALGNGDGTFQTPVSFPNNYTFLSGDFAVADFNNDGKLDIVTYNTTLSNQVQFSVFLQK